MNRAFLLGGLFLRVSSVYATETHDLIKEGRKRNEEVYERGLNEEALNKLSDSWHTNKATSADKKNEKPVKPENN